MAFQVTTGTAIVYGSEVGDDVAFSVESTANNAGRQSANYDFGDISSTGRSPYYEASAYTQAQATPTVDNPCKVHYKLSTDNSTSHMTNDDGTSDAAVSAEDKLKNTMHLGNILCDQAAANIEFGAVFGLIEIYQRYGAVIWWNEFGSALTATESEHKFILTPIAPADA